MKFYPLAYAVPEVIGTKLAARTLFVSCFFLKKSLPASRFSPA
ncbi:hypothetical protein CHCC20335_4062 [Bacillus paralicheniformis]|nr:hypothetical protein CHCC20335_4062 [Bacillus paralicheniformis]